MRNTDNNTEGKTMIDIAHAVKCVVINWITTGLCIAFGIAAAVCGVYFLIG